MADKPKAKINTWIGAETGLLKSVDLVNKVATNHFAHFGKNYEVLSMCWGENSCLELYTGHKNGKVRKFNVESNSYSDCYDIPDYENQSDNLVSLYKTENKFITCTTAGQLKVWNHSNCDKDDVLNVMVGARTQCTAFNLKDNLLASGGYCNRLKIWDLNNTRKPIYQAKNVKPDWLLLEVPINVMQIKFVPDGSGRVLTTTGTHNLRLYDPKTDRRPVMETSFNEHPITSAAISERNPNKVFVGNTRGFAACFDLRKLTKMVRSYKGFAGSIRSIVAHKSQPYIFSCGLDRHLCVHHEESLKPKFKVYLKSKLNCLLVSDFSVEDDTVQIIEEESNLKRKFPNNDALENKSDSDDEHDDMWNKMRRVSDDSDDDSDDSDL